MVAVLSLVPAAVAALAVVARQVRLNAESRRKYELARHVFDQSRKIDIMTDVADVTRADRPPMALGWKPTQQIKRDPTDSSG